MTAAIRTSFEMVFLAVSQRWPVLLYGPAGAGKTATINRLAQGHGSQGIYCLLQLTIKEINSCICILAILLFDQYILIFPPVKP